MSDALQIRHAHRLPQGRTLRELMLACYDSCHQDGDAIGFLPTLAYDQARDRGRLYGLWTNADLVGYLLHSSHLTETRICQIWVRADARMILHGRALCDELDRVAMYHGSYRTRLWCAHDLPANLFWAALGYRARGWRYSPTKKGRRAILWTRDVPAAINPSLLPARRTHDALQAHTSPPPTCR